MPYRLWRVRGELSKVTFHSSGHVYLDIKGRGAPRRSPGWSGKPTCAASPDKPQTGMEVVVTGRITTYPGRSAKYQIIIETMAPEPAAALLAAARAAEGQAGGRGPLRDRAQAPTALDAGCDRRHHQPHRRGDPRYPAPHPRAAGRAGGGLAHRRAGRDRRPGKWPPPSPGSTPRSPAGGYRGQTF